MTKTLKYCGKSVMDYSEDHVTFSCDYSKVTKGLHGK